MSRLLQKVKDAMTNRESKSKRLGRDSDSWSYGNAYERNTTDGAGEVQSNYAPYHSNDYGSRFGSHGPHRPGTYGSGDYGFNTRPASFSEYSPGTNGGSYGNAANGYGYASSKPGSYGPGREFGSVGSGGLRAERSQFHNGWRYSYSSGSQMGSMPVDRAQRSQW
ncbi:hypothetical protein BDV18DRAFT_133222 [Aspergillus unguis]